MYRYSICTLNGCLYVMLSTIRVCCNMHLAFVTSASNAKNRSAVSPGALRVLFLATFQPTSTSQHTICRFVGKFQSENVWKNVHAKCTETQSIH